MAQREQTLQLASSGDKILITPMRHRKDIFTEESLIRTGTFYYPCVEKGREGGGGIWDEVGG